MYHVFGRVLACDGSDCFALTHIPGAGDEAARDVGRGEEEKRHRAVAGGGMLGNFPAYTTTAQHLEAKGTRSVDPKHLIFRDVLFIFSQQSKSIKRNHRRGRRVFV